MDEPYRIRVLHIINPHIIFVESQAQKGMPVLQQIGIYGILPVNKTIEIDGQVVIQRCEHWPVAANTILTEFLAGLNNRVYFVPIQVEKMSTIFDENTYQFGDIIVKGEKVISATDHLIELSVADNDECVFEQKLKSGILQIKLNPIKTEEVLNAIKKYYQKQKNVGHDWEKTIKKQTSLYQESKKISLFLTEHNLRLSEKNSSHLESIMGIIERKEKDLELCKDADDIGIGRGNGHKRSSCQGVNSHVKTYANITESDNLNSQNRLNNMNKVLETHLKKNENTQNINHIEIKNNTLQHPIYEKYKHSDQTFSIDEHYDVNRQDIRQKQEENLKENLVSDNTMKVKDHSYDKKIESNVTRKKNMSFMKHKEKLLVYCPDMEFSFDNLKKITPIKVTDDYANHNSINSPTLVNNISNSKIHNEDCKDNLKPMLHGNSYDEINYKNNNKNILHEQKCNSNGTKDKTLNNVEHKLVSLSLRRRLQILKESQKVIDMNSL